jgi:hypothetical protein
MSIATIANAWFYKCKELEMDQAIFLRVANKGEQTELSNALEAERNLLAKLDPILASQLFVNKTLMAGKQYVVVERKYRSPFTGFLKDETGKMEKISVDPERHRMIRLMIKDGKERDEVEETLNGLTDEEIDMFY